MYSGSVSEDLPTVPVLLDIECDLHSKGQLMRVGTDMEYCG